MLGEDAALQGVALLLGHGADIERIGGCLFGGLLELAAINELNLGNGHSSGFASILVLQAAAQSGENCRPVVVERLCCTFSDARSRFAQREAVAVELPRR